jgi:hypothetical protein
MGELVDSPISTREGPEPIKPKSKRVWQKKVTSPLEASSQETNRGI